LLRRSIYGAIGGRGGGGGAPASALDLSGGTNIGDLTVNGDIGVLFDEITDQDAASSAAKSNVSNAQSAYGGKTLAAAARIESATVFGSNNVGYIIGANPTVTITLFGKTGAAPANSGDGTQIGQISFTDTANENVGREIASTDTDTAWDNVWIRVVHNNGSAAGVFVAELQLVGWV